MNYAQGFVSNRVCEILNLSLFSGVICTILIISIIAVFQKLDNELVINKQEGTWYRLTLLWILLGSVIMVRSLGDFVGGAKALIMLVYLAVCSITDYYIQQVYDCFQLYICCIMGGFIAGTEPAPSLGMELLLFVLIQGLLFKHMYGTADTIGFLICALSLINEGLFGWIMHMALTFLFLGAVQGIKRNIGRDGNLKISVPLFPYMMAAYLFVFWQSSCTNLIFLV